MRCLLPAMGVAHTYNIKLLIHSVRVSELLQVRLQLSPRYRSLFRTPANADQTLRREQCINVRHLTTRVIDLIEL